MPVWAIVTTKADISRDLFLASGDIYYYDDVDPETLQSYQIIYFRDPFNTGHYDMPEISEKIEQVVRYCPNAIFIDHIHSLDDVLIEDKWRQYQLFKSYMPHTKILEAAEELNDTHIAKKRISARARDIVFYSADIKHPLQEYVIQERLVINDEYRVYVIRGKVQTLVSGKSSKTTSHKVKIQALEDLQDDIKEFSESIARIVPYLDFFGLDIARTDSGLYLIELNRSPQFARYRQLGGIDILSTLTHSVYFEKNVFTDTRQSQ